MNDKTEREMCGTCMFWQPSNTEPGLGVCLLHSEKDCLSSNTRLAMVRPAGQAKLITYGIFCCTDWREGPSA